MMAMVYLHYCRQYAFEYQLPGITDGKSAVALRSCFQGLWLVIVNQAFGLIQHPLIFLSTVFHLSAFSPP